MCTDIEFGNSTLEQDYDISSLGQLKAAYGAYITREDLQFPEDFDTTGHGEYCLCGVDIPAILDRAGVTYVDGTFGYEVKEYLPKDPDPAFEA